LSRISHGTQYDRLQELPKFSSAPILRYCCHHPLSSLNDNFTPNQSQTSPSESIYVRCLNNNWETKTGRSTRPSNRSLAAMRLINTQTMALEEFIDSKNAPPYAILSHAWEVGEVAFQDFSNIETASLKQGFGKIRRTCSLAEAKGIGYAWVDTCCIDKTSSAELTEAINSMFQWYAESQVCYVWLSDMAPYQLRENNFSRCRCVT
jgi:hypothetical protein